MGELNKVFKWLGYFVKASLAAEALAQVLMKVKRLELGIKAVHVANSVGPAEKREEDVVKALAALYTEYQIIVNDIRTIRDTFR